MGMLRKLSIRTIIKSTRQMIWFGVFILLVQCIPPYTTHGYPWIAWGKVNAYILTHPIKNLANDLVPFFQIIPLCFLIAMFFAAKQVLRAFMVYMALLYILVAFLQNVSVNATYGLSVCTANVVTFLFLAYLWLREAWFTKGNNEVKKMAVWRYWTIPLALIPFWGPINLHTLAPDFNPVYLLTSGSGLSFCLATPLFLAVLTTWLSDANKPALFTTGLVGVFISLGNLVLEFVIDPSLWWIGVLHFPLLILSSYTLWLLLGRIIQQEKKSL